MRATLLRDTVIKAILFDKDGTLFDFKMTWGHWAAQFFRQIAADEAQAVRFAGALGFDLVSNHFDPNSPIVVGPHGVIAGTLQKQGALGGDLEAIERAMEEGARQVIPQPPVPLLGLCEDLRAAGLRLGCATNDTRGAADHQLTQAGVRELFDFTIGSDSVRRPKPHPEMCLAFASAMKVAPDQCLMVGDSLHDIDAGKAAGMITVGVLTGVQEAHVLEPQCDLLLPHIGALPGALLLSQRNEAVAR